MADLKDTIADPLLRFITISWNFMEPASGFPFRDQQVEFHSDAGIVVPRF